MPITASEGITYQWMMGELAANSQATVTISGRIASLVGTVLTNQATIAVTQDITAVNNEREPIPFVVLNGPPKVPIIERVILEDQPTTLALLEDVGGPSPDTLFLQL